MSEEQQVVANRRLGRGLSSLLGNNAPAPVEAAAPNERRGELQYLPIARIVRNPFQPRQQFDKESLGELASSIKEHGMIQPVIVRELDGGFQLIAGERRWQAAQKAGLTTIPCRVVDVIDQTACEFAIEENLKRKDLNDLEKAQAFRDYLDMFDCTMEELAKQISMSRSAVNNMLRLLELCDPVKNAMHAERITAGHARALLPLSEADQLALCGRIQAEKLSVRKTEAAVRELLDRPQPPSVVAQQKLESAQEAEATASEQATPEPGHDSAVEQQPTTDDTSHDAVAVAGEIESAVSSEDAAQESSEASVADSGDEDAQTIPISQGEVERTSHVNSLESQLRDLLGVKVDIKLRSKDSGIIQIPFSSNEEFERVMKLVRRAAA